MLSGIMLAGALLLAPVSVTAVVDTTAVFVEELDHDDLSYLKTESVGIMGDSISTYTGRSIEGGSAPVYPDAYVTDNAQMWWSALNVQSNSSVAGSYVTNREDGEYVNFNSDTRVGALGDVSSVIIYGGTCDLLANVSVESFESGLRSLVGNVQFGDMRKTVLCTLPPIKQRGANNCSYRDYNKVIRKVAVETNSRLCEFEDAWTFAEIDTCTEDGIHPNVEGMSRLALRFN